MCRTGLKRSSRRESSGAGCHLALPSRPGRRALSSRRGGDERASRWRWSRSLWWRRKTGNQAVESTRFLTRRCNSCRRPTISLRLNSHARISCVWKLSCRESEARIYLNSRILRGCLRPIINSSTAEETMKSYRRFLFHFENYKLARNLTIIMSMIYLFIKTNKTVGLKNKIYWLKGTKKKKKINKFHINAFL